eukprot:TRINITY_DN3591_c0_g1_i1.p1 TRINITY_DN3591_c0_g1~~TRINITY_DN3591_c0_g1_i1.p1  ORF type:complete len:155 (+),score=39.20 TRINITY_DN3591_c0_g1_i1:287-751(+)
MLLDKIFEVVAGKAKAIIDPEQYVKGKVGNIDIRGPIDYILYPNPHEISPYEFDFKSSKALVVLEAKKMHLALGEHIAQIIAECAAVGAQGLITNGKDWYYIKENLAQGKVCGVFKDIRKDGKKYLVVNPLILRQLVDVLFELMKESPTLHYDG